MRPRSPSQHPKHSPFRLAVRRQEFLLFLLLAGATMVCVWFQDLMTTTKVGTESHPLLSVHPPFLEQWKNNRNSPSFVRMTVTTTEKSSSSSTRLRQRPEVDALLHVHAAQQEAAIRETGLDAREREGEDESPDFLGYHQLAEEKDVENGNDQHHQQPENAHAGDEPVKEEGRRGDTGAASDADGVGAVVLDSQDSVDPADKNPVQVEKQVRAATADAAAQQQQAKEEEEEEKETSTSTTTQQRKERSKSGTSHKVKLREEDFPERPVSPYEVRWPGYTLPEWASKPFYFRRETYSKRVCYVHVGKAAGSSVGCSLGFQLHCHSEYIYPSGLLPSCTTNIMHNDINDCALDMDYYMFTMRNPIERIKSWFLYDLKYLDELRSPKHGCGFLTLHQLTEVGLQQTHLPKDDTRECHKLALRVVRGEQKMGNHAYHNYRYYLNQVPTNATITVVRAEHMLDDWNSMERLLNSDAPMVANLPSKNENKKYNPHDKYVSELGLKHLCAALCDEIQVYKLLLTRAANLKPHQVDESMDELRQVCPDEVDQAGCPR